MTHTETQSQASANEVGSAFSKMIVDILFFGAITMIKVIGCYIYMTLIITVVSLLTLTGVVLAAALLGMFLGKTIAILAGVLLFGLVLVGPFARWMTAIKTAAKREFFGKTED